MEPILGMALCWVIGFLASVWAYTSSVAENRAERRMLEHARQLHMYAAQQYWSQR